MLDTNGDDAFIGELELAMLRTDSSASDQLRAAAIRGYDAFRSLDVTADTHLEETLVEGGFATGFADGKVSERDLDLYPGKLFALVALQPYASPIAASGGIIDDPSTISRADVDQFLDSTAPEYAKHAAFYHLDHTGNFDWSPTVAFLDGVPLQTPSPPANAPELLEIRAPAEAKNPKWWETGIKFTFRRLIPPIVAYQSGQALRERLLAEAPQYIHVIDPATGAIQKSVPIQILADTPEEYWPIDIEEILESPGIPRRTTEEDRTRCAEAWPEAERLILADEALQDARRINQQSIEEVPPSEVFGLQTVAVFAACDTTTLELKRFSAAQFNLDEEQEVFALGLGIVPIVDPTPGLHAEPKVFYHAMATGGLVPLAISTTNGFCAPTGQNCLEALGGPVGAVILSADVVNGRARRRAYWPPAA